MKLKIDEKILDKLKELIIKKYKLNNEQINNMNQNSTELYIDDFGKKQMVKVALEVL